MAWHELGYAGFRLRPGTVPHDLQGRPVMIQAGDSGASHGRVTGVARLRGSVSRVLPGRREAFEIASVASSELSGTV